MTTWLVSCGNPAKHGPHDECVGIPLPPIRDQAEDDPAAPTARYEPSAETPTVEVPNA